MLDQKYSSFIYFSDRCTGKSGRKVYIDPNLLIRFSECVEPHSAAGVMIARQIGDQLTATPDGHNSGSAVIKSNRYYKDFGDANSQQIRLYYDIFQDNGGGTNRGEGVYIYDIKKLLKSNESEKPGLYKIKYNQNINNWMAEGNKGKILDEKKVVIAAYRHNGVYKTDLTTKTVSKYFPNHKDSYNLYFCPDYILDNNAQWETPGQRIDHKAGPAELADILINSCNKWDTNNMGEYTTHVFTEGAKTLLEALNIIQKQNKSLETHTFKFYSPDASLAQLKPAIEQCGGNLNDDWVTITDNNSKLYQEQDANNLADVLPPSAGVDAALSKHTKRKAILAHKNATFFALWKG